jgi:hypothetical protein
MPAPRYLLRLANGRYAAGAGRDGVVRYTPPGKPSSALRFSNVQKAIDWMVLHSSYNSYNPEIGLASKGTNVVAESNPTTRLVTWHY